MTADDPRLRVSAMGDGALLCQVDGPLDQAIQERFWELAEAVRARPGVTETVVGMNNLLVLYDALGTEPGALEEALVSLWAVAPPGRACGALVEIPVVYGGPGGLDLSAVAAATGLSPEEYVRRHAAATYVVFALGSMPGFAYLAGLDPALAVPRRPTPRTAVEAGSVIVGGVQAGVMPCTAPSGWHIIGRTPLALFDPAGQPPTLLAPGDRVRFVAQEPAP
ncbi:5-oxoprolinase subunit PxpB [Methylobacterium nodulans]|uniref:Allophanate hydrolase subunit 1 n=1 Tax=Methylobacterium nodulans (strain LMG 21967 / CNCM I-2342 / ORS 2060) TaxID=460265 RepID=B8IGM1_METNO|nr:5-oxoprolinase subunit PxpB [Methylobacterium nodulans]ACL55921.1 Allophanate hydrolase subunit 1 [Methylobacterium nodulans ORS 2060]